MLTQVQWRFEKLHEGPGWVIQNVGTGKYLSISQGAGDGVHVVGAGDHATGTGVDTEPGGPAAGDRPDARRGWCAGGRTPGGPP